MTGCVAWLASCGIILHLSSFRRDWSRYNARLKRRGDLTILIDPALIAGWSVHELGAIQRIPPDRKARPSRENRNWTPADRTVLAERDAAIAHILETDRATWKEESGYHRRSLAETAMWRITQASKARPSNRTEPNRRTQARIKCKPANILLAA